MDAMKLVIIGAGPGGYSAAIRAAHLGAKVTLIDKDKPGGTCLNWGCIPSKIMRKSADVCREVAEAAKFGVDLPSEPSLNMQTMRARQRSVVDMQVTGLAKHFKALGIDLVSGAAFVEKRGTVTVRNADGETTPYEYDNLLVACGSTPASLPGLEADGKTILNSDHALWMDDLPRSLLVIGGGVIGCELAQIFHDFGVAVTLVEALPRLLPVPGLDEEISKNYMRSLKKAKLPFYAGHTVAGTRASQNGVTVTVKPVSGEGKELELEVEKVLVATGRKSVAASLGLENTGVRIDQRGWVEAGDDFRTADDAVWAIGDCLGPSRIMLAHTATAEGLAAVENMFGGKETLNYAAVPSAIFTAPEIGSVGRSLAQAEEYAPGSKASDFLFRQLGKAQAMGEIDGLVRLVTGPDGVLLGGHIMGACATSLIAELGLAVTHGLTADAVARTIHAHPTLPEGIWEATLAAAGRPLHGA